MVLKEQRHKLILDCLAQEEYVSLPTLVEKTEIPLSTLRRDINELAAKDQLVKVRGGATLKESKTDSPRPSRNEPIFESRQLSNRDEKIRIANEALKLIHSGDTVLIDCGTTAYELSKLLAKNREFENLMVATCDLHSACALAENEEVNLIMIGGKVRNKYFSVTGFFGENMMEQIHADISFITLDSIDIKRGLMAYNLDEVGIKKRMMKSAKEIVVLADHDKFKQIAFVKIADLHDVDVIITSSQVDKKIVDSLTDMGIKVIVT